jgi:Zn-finger nucleic acid-binding protein
LKCPNCGARLEKTHSGDYRCDYCDTVYDRKEIVGATEHSEAEQPKEVIREIHHYHDEPDKLSFGLGCLSFFIFPVGWIIWATNKDTKPRKARTALVIAIIVTLFFLIGVIGGGGN